MQFFFFVLIKYVIERGQRYREVFFFYEKKSICSFLLVKLMSQQLVFNLKADKSNL